MRNENMPRSIVVSVFLAGFVLLGGCASEPTIDMTPEAEVTFDGLHEIKNSRADVAWARPDSDISQYSKIKLAGAGISYRPGGDTRRLYSPTNVKDHFALTEDQKERLEALVADEFRKELAKSEHFELVDEVGPDVLLITGALIDVVSFVPPQAAGRVDVYLSRVGEATLVLEIADSMTETVLARAIDRRAAEQGVVMTKSSRPLNTSEVRRMISRWASRLRESLDEYGGPQE